MNRNALLVTVIVVVFAAIALFFYDYYSNKPDSTVWLLVPESATLVYEPQSGLESWDYLKESEWWQTLSEIEPWAKLDSQIIHIDTLIGRSKLNPLLSDGKFLAAISPTSGNNSDFLLLLKRGSNSEISVLNEIIGDYISEDLRLKGREFQGFSITEVSQRGEDWIFSFSSNDNYWFGSFTPVLVEDAIRQANGQEDYRFQAANPEPFFNSRIKQDAGNIYFNYDKFASLFATFLNSSERSKKEGIADLGKNAFFDISLNNQLLILNGFTYLSSPDDYLARLGGSAPEASMIEQYIPASTAFCIHTLYNATLDRLEGEPKLKDLKTTLKPEYAVAVLEGQDMEASDKLYYLRSSAIDRSMEILSTYAAGIQAENQDTLYYEDFSGQRIIELRSPGFMNYFSDNTFGDRSVYFFTSVNDYLVFGPSIESVKKFLLELESETTWGKSVQKNNFMSSTLQESNFNIYIDVNKSWNYMIKRLDQKWADHFTNYEELYRKFELMAIQFSLTDNKFYSNIVVSHNPERTELFARRRKLAPDIVAETEAKITTDPFVVRNHQNNQREVILQDESKALSLFGASGRRLWSDTLPSAIISDIHQIDFFQNGFLQYMVATDSAIWLYDRNGNVVEGFPWRLPFKADQFNVIDYDNSKRYRFMISDLRGNVYMYNKEGVQLDGWRPNPAGGKLALPPKHFRVRGRDCIMVLLQNGKLLMYNRRGELQKGFPYDLGPYIQKNYAVKYGSDFSSSVLSFVSIRGEVTEINLEGKLVNQEQLIPTSRNSIFDIVPERQGKGHIFVQKELAFFRILNEEGKEIMRKDLISQSPFIYQYYEFGSNRNLYILTDVDQEYSYIYNEKGELVNNIPIESKFNIGVLFSEVNNQYKIYSAFANQINIYVF